ncbi:hypothetical protein [Desulfospira joergensenii]|uniref:hypothetical protein n=1 Tax=Desulfospira joergensenii TaxID=53329 RepID=UPI0003B671EC|nr:hypothetical protein [Desulfospira joergensenii]
MDKDEIDRWFLSGFKKVTGIKAAFPLFDEDREKILDIEQDAEDRSLMGLGKVINSGVRKVLNDQRVYVALTDMDFEWGCHSTLILKKGSEVVGREIRDKDEIEKLSGKENVWFMHRNFVVFKDKISFPGDIMKKICHFEIPGLEGDWCKPENEKIKCRSAVFANPATPCDVYLKEKYFKGNDERGLGTVLIGINLEGILDH